MRKSVVHTLVLLLAAAGPRITVGQGASPVEVAGWRNVMGAEEAWSIRDGVIRTTGSPKSVLRTERQYENYILEFDFQASDGAGLILHADALPAAGSPWPRGIDVRLGEDSAAPSISPLAGAMIEPVVVPDGKVVGGSTSRGSAAPPEWRQARIESRDGRVALSIDGEVTSTGYYASPRKGYIALKSDGSKVHFRDVRIEELPSTDPAPYEVAEAEEGFVSMYDGTDLSHGWDLKPGHRGHWSAQDWLIDYDGASEERDKSLWTTKAYGDFILMADVRLTREPEPDMLPVVLPSGIDAQDEEGNPIMVEVPYAGDTGIYLRGSSKSQINIGNRYVGSGDVYGYRADSKMPPEVRRAVTPRVKANHPPGEWDRYVITMIGETLSVELNGKLIIDQAHLPGIDPTGKIALQDDHADGNTFQFANLYIKELD